LQIVPMSRRAFEKAFVEHVGRAPGQEIRRVRTERAQALLADTELYVTQIAELTGFPDQPSFSRFFHTCTGLSPSQYRSLQAGDSGLHEGDIPLRSAS
jgi:transcriptional regulator GlxA family with amidase domain